MQNIIADLHKIFFSFKLYIGTTMNANKIHVCIKIVHLFHFNKMAES